MTKQDKKMVNCAKECDSIGEMACPNGTMTGGVCCEKLLQACDDIGPAEVLAIAERLRHARGKHPDNGGCRSGSFSAIEDEFFEFDRAFFDEPEFRVKDEALDVIATCIRYRGEEYA